MNRLALAVAVVTGAAVSAQQTTFRSGVETVRVDVSVMRGNQPVRGLSADDFVVTDNKVAQRVETASVDALPLSVLLVLDTSGSVAGTRLAHLIEAGKLLIAALRPSDRAALVTFSARVSIPVLLTRQLALMRNALDRLEGRGPTAIRDAVYAALLMAPEDDSRPMVLLFTDGRDNTSWLSESDLMTAAQRVGVVVHVVSLADAPDEFAVPGQAAIPADRPEATFLQHLVDAGGGRVWPATTSKDLQPLFIKALDEMRARYVLSFTPQGVKREGWHDLKVTLKNGRAGINARSGYLVAPER